MTLGFIFLEETKCVILADSRTIYNSDLRVNKGTMHMDILIQGAWSWVDRSIVRLLAIIVKKLYRGS